MYTYIYIYIYVYVILYAAFIYCHFGGQGVVGTCVWQLPARRHEGETRSNPSRPLVWTGRWESRTWNLLMYTADPDKDQKIGLQFSGESECLKNAPRFNCQVCHWQEGKSSYPSFFFSRQTLRTRCAIVRRWPPSWKSWAGRRPWWFAVDFALFLVKSGHLLDQHMRSIYRNNHQQIHTEQTKITNNHPKKNFYIQQ